MGAKVFVVHEYAVFQLPYVAFPGIQIFDQERQPNIAVPDEIPHRDRVSINGVIDGVVDKLLFVRGLPLRELEVP